MGRKRDLVSKTASKIAEPLRHITPKYSEKHQSSPRLTILMFHRILDETPQTETERDLLMTTQTFRKYCEFFSEKFLICTLHEARELLKTGTAKPLMVFSFDDGYGNFYANAFPILKELNIKSNQNIIARYTDEHRQGFLGWDEVREMHNSGLVEFGCHTYDKHRLIDEKPVILKDNAEEIIKDLRRAGKSFKENLGFLPYILAWPYGFVPRNVSRSELSSLGFSFLLNTTSGMNYYPVDFMNLKRFAALEYETPEKLYSIIKGYDDLGFLLRK